METENYLTRQANQTYSRSMPDGSNPDVSSSLSPDLRGGVPQAVLIRNQISNPPMPELRPSPGQALNADPMEVMRTMDFLKQKWATENTPIDQRRTEELMARNGVGVGGFAREFMEAGAMPDIFASVGAITDPTLQKYVDSIGEYAQQYDVSPGYLDIITNQILEFNRLQTDPVIRAEGIKVLGAVREAVEASIKNANRGNRRETFDVEEIKTNREVRANTVQELFDAADAFPKEQWQQAFNPFTIGAIYQDLIKEMQKEVSRLSKEAATHPLNATDAENLLALQEDLENFQTEESVRNILHDLNSVVYVPNVKMENILDFVDRAKSSEVDYAMRMPGVRQMMDIYEECIRESMMEHHGYLVPEEVLGITESVTETRGARQVVVSKIRDSKTQERAMKRFKAMADAGLIYSSDINGGRQTQDWNDASVRRVFAMARGGMVLDLRLLSLAAESKLPRGAARWNSLFLQDAMQSYSVYRHLAAKFNVAEESMIPLLFEEEFGSEAFKMMDPKEVSKIFHQWEEHPDEMLDTLTKFFPLNRTNPYRMGDLFTWQSWRYDDKNRSIVTGFLDRGINRSLARAYPAGFMGMPKSEDYREFLVYPPSEAAHEHNHHKKEQLMKDLWTQKYPLAPSLDEYKKWAGKYEQWVGTSIRFEKLRMKLTDFKPMEKGGKEQIEDLRRKRDKAERYIAAGLEVPKTLKEAKENIEALETAIGTTDKQGLIETMVKIQPHRVFRIMNEKTREAIIASLPAGQRSKEDIENALMHLSFAETSLNKRREDIIMDPADKQYDDLDIIIDSGYNPQGPQAQEWIRAQTLARAVRQHYSGNKQEFHDEFIFHREFRHGFALWVDAPLDEFNFSGIGDTGVARRARDNKLVGKAAAAELELLNNLKKIHTADELQPFLNTIFHEIEQHDPTRAKMIIEERLKMYLKFYAASWKDNVPGVGYLNGALGKNSVARIIYGKSAGVFHADTMAAIVRKNKELGQIRPNKQNEIRKDVAAGRLAVSSDVASTAMELLAIGFFLYMASHLNDKT